jgi:hypothetical protein
MEPITLCGLAIVMFGLWVELETTAKAVLKIFRKNKLFTVFFSNSAAQKPGYVSKMPICVNRISNLT